MKLRWDTWYCMLRNQLSINSCVCVGMSRHWARGKFGEHERGKSCSKSIRVQLRPPECSPNFPSSQFLDISTAEEWTNCFITLSKISVQQLPLMFTIITPAQSRTRQNGYVTIFYLKHSYVFVLKVRESLIKQLKITVKKIFESTLRVRKTSNSPKNSFWKK